MKDNRYEEKNVIYICKAIAIFSAVSAHVAGVGSNVPEMELFFFRLLSAWGTFGVPVFYLAAGYLYERSLQKHDIMYIFKGKLKSIILPWLICGTAVWLYVVLRKGGLTLGGWASFILGESSYLYFMTVLVLLYILYSLFRKYTWLLYAGIVLCITANAITAFWGWHLPFSVYLNVFAWQGWFFIGGLIQMKSWQNKIPGIMKKCWFVSIPAGLAIVLWYCFHGSTIFYWHKYFLVIEVLLLPLLYCGVRGAMKCRAVEKVFVAVGKKSFSIYLLHMPVAGILANLMDRFPNGMLIFFRPFMAVFVTYGCITAFERICSSLRIDKLCEWCIGTRKA